VRDTEFEIVALAFPRIYFKIPEYYIEGFMPRIREILKVDSKPGRVKDNGFIINTQKIFSFGNTTGLLIIHDVSVDLFNRWPIACVKIGRKIRNGVSLQTTCGTPNIY
jgi:hypothetical protein